MATIHSFRRVLKPRRDIHTIREPGGKVWVLWRPVPMLGLAYFVALEVLFFAVSRLPVIGTVLDPFTHLSLPLWWIVPGVLAHWLVTSTAFDGRLPHRWVQSYVQFWVRPKRTRGGVPVKDSPASFRVRAWMDEHAPDLHRSRINGPASVRFNVPVRFGLSAVNRHFRARQARDGDPPAEPYEVTERLEVKP
jgi:hypothetical protein